MSLNIVLIEPEIPQNTGNIARTCAILGCKLHLVRPFGFAMTDKNLKRAGLDYWDKVDIVYHENWVTFLEKHGQERLWLTTDKGRLLPDQVHFQLYDWLVFGQETSGLPSDLLACYSDQLVRLPMKKNHRSFNLSNAVAIFAYEALRQLRWPGLI